jgi:hypothetical protein
MDPSDPDPQTEHVAVALQADPDHDVHRPLRHQPVADLDRYRWGHGWEQRRGPMAAEAA